MFEQLFKPRIAVQRHYQAPLCAERVRYLRHLVENGAARATLVKTAPYLLSIVASLRMASPIAVTPEQIAVAADTWISRQPGSRCRKHGQAARRTFASIASDWFRFLGLLHTDGVEPPYTLQLEVFSSYLREERALSPATIRMSRCRTKEFLSFFHSEGISLDMLGLDTVDRLISVKACRDGLTPASMQRYVYDLRSFLRYAEAQGWSQSGLAAALRPGRVYRGEGPPIAPSWDIVLKLLTGMHGDRPRQIRDRAIVLLFALYGLRAAEVRRLRLSDLDWENALIHVHCSKPNQHTRCYPLAATVADALARYLQSVRPKSQRREVFLHVRAPYQPLSNSALWQIVCYRLRPLEPRLKHHGPHSLRHACATRLLQSGMGMKEIGDFLGHHHPASTAVYAAVDLDGLRRVAELDLGRFL
jgi:integrase/recombinase XerD